MLLVLSMWPFLPESVTCAVCRATTPPWVTSYINILAPECVTATNYCPFVAHSAVEVAAPSGGTRTSSSGANGNNTVAHLPPTHPHTNIVAHNAKPVLSGVYTTCARCQRHCFRVWAGFHSYVCSIPPTHTFSRCHFDVFTEMPCPASNDVTRSAQHHSNAHAHVVNSKADETVLKRYY
jgi:hypothetical protein